jgi:hypothetical protein
VSQFTARRLFGGINYTMLYGHERAWIFPMVSTGVSELCAVCKRGHIGKHPEHFAFTQWTDKGIVSCEVKIEVSVCNHCGFRAWDETAEAAMNEAVRREYAKLP